MLRTVLWLEFLEENSYGKGKDFKYNRLIGKHENGCEFIKEYRDYIISGGSDKKLLIYDNSFKKLTEITSKNWINNIFVSKKIKNFCSIILLCTKNEIIVNEFSCSS